MTKTFQTEGHDYFTVSKTGVDIPESGERVAVHFSEAPKGLANAAHEVVKADAPA